MTTGSMSKKDVVRILEEEIGEFKRAWRNQNSNIQVVEFSRATNETSILMTLGLSDFRLSSESQSFAFELLCEFQDASQKKLVARLMDELCMLFLEKKMSAPQRGSYLLLDNRFQNLAKDVSAIYFSNPIYRSEKFVSELNTQNIFCVALYFLNSKETEILETKGWRALEDHWDNNSSDLLAISR